MLIDLPFDLLAIIVTLAITSDINIDNYKTIPHIITPFYISNADFQQAS